MPGMLLCVVREYASLQHVGQSHHFCVCAPNSKFVHSRLLNVLFCTSVTSWVIINKFHVVNNDPTNVHVLEFGPSYDVRNGAEKQLPSPAIGLVARGSGGPNGTPGPPRLTLFGLRNRRPIKSHMSRCHCSSTE